ALHRTGDTIVLVGISYTDICFRCSADSARKRIFTEFNSSHILSKTPGNPGGFIYIQALWPYPASAGTRQESGTHGLGRGHKSWLRLSSGGCATMHRMQGSCVSIPGTPPA